MNPLPILAPIRVQIVEDEQIVAHDLRQNLESMGYAVTGIASSEQQAVDLAERERPDLVLMDINLGRGGDGTRAAGLITQRFQLPVIYLTAYAGDDILKKAIQAAPYGYVLKPFEPRELNATIRAALSRVEMEKETRKAEKRFRLALDAAKLGVLEVARNGDQIAIDGFLHSILETPVRSFVVNRQDFLIRLEDQEVRGRLQGMLEGGDMIEICAAWLRDDGQRVWLEIHASYFADEDKVIGILRDVTDKIQAEEELRQASVVFESAGEGILILDSEQRVRMVNQSFRRLTGWTLADILDKRPDDFLHSVRASDRKPVADRASAEASPFEVVCRREDESLFPAWENLAPVITSSGQISHYVLSICDISALRSAESRLSHIALHDALTGLGNRHQLDICLRHNISRKTGGGGDQFALLFIDLDGFKTINDSLGHSVGDELLVEVTRRLKRSLRQDDIAIRMGGDEFVVIVDGLHAEEAVSQLCRKLLTAVAEPIATSIGQTVRTTASIGIALFPEHADSADALIRAADTAMYAAKEGGRNRQVMFSTAMSHRALERMQLEQGLRSAIDNHELELHWQPVIDMRDGRVIGAEALLRWNHPTSGRISPERFIPVAEETGMILAIGDWVLEQACRDAAAWAAEGLELGRLAINVSARQLQQDGFADRVQSFLVQFNLSPAILEIELTESSLQRGELVLISLHKLRSLGVKLALDDFGTGFSSLSMLKFLPLDRLKIDRSFIRDISSAPNDMAIARTIAAMASTLGLAVTAEGVETDIQRHILLGLSVREAQGWLYHPALRAREFAELLRRQKEG